DLIAPAPSALYTLSLHDALPICVEARRDQHRIDLAAEQSLADGVIARLPKGYDQQLGRLFRQGRDLSGGEWQKIAIARAYMRDRSEEHTSELQSRENLVCRLLLE